MEILCRCGSCDTLFKMAARHAGRKAKCPQCGTVVVVPTVEPEPVPGGPPPAEGPAEPRRRVADPEPPADQATALDFPELSPPVPRGGVVLNPDAPSPPSPTGTKLGEGKLGEHKPAGVSGSAKPGSGIARKTRPLPPRPGASAPATPPPPPAPSQPAATSPGHAVHPAVSHPSPSPQQSSQQSTDAADSQDSFPVKIAARPQAGRGRRAAGVHSESESGGTSTGSRGARGRRGIRPLYWALGGGAAALVVVVVSITALVISFSGGGDAGRGGGKPILELNIPVEQRGDIALSINRKRQELGADPQCLVALEPGTHTITLQRRGFKQIDHTITLRAGERLPFAPQWEKVDLPTTTGNGVASGATGSSGTVGTPGTPQQGAGNQPAGPLNFPGWLQNMEVAMRHARERKKDIFLVFSGSDWSRLSVEMANSIFATERFRSFADQRFIPIVIDLPKTEIGRNQLENVAQNAHLSRQFGIRAVPVVVMMDADGAPYAVDGFFGDGVEKYIPHATLMYAKRASRDARLAAVDNTKLAPAERIANAEKALDWLRDEKLTAYYGRSISSWLSLARQVDPANQLGKQELFFETDWLIRLNQAIVDNEPEDTRRILDELQKWSEQHKFLDPNRAVRLNLLAGSLYVRMFSLPEQASQHAALASTYEPTDEQLRADLAGFKNALRRSDQLSSGAGFVVDSRGYLLTNHHVIEGPGRTVVRVTGGDQQVDATVVAYDAKRDIALLKVDPSKFASFAPLTLVDSRVRRGSDVAVFGFPLGDDLARDVRINVGVVHAPPEQSEDKLLMLDCRINPGNSGGPAVNRSGQVIGMVSAKTENSLGIDSYGIAIPSSDLVVFLKRHLMDFTYASPGESAPAQEDVTLARWDEIDQKVSPSVLMVLKVR